MSLLELKLGQESVIQSLQGPEELIARLVDMGFHQRVEVKMLQRLPFSGPYIIRVGSGTFALRPEEAACIQI